MKCPHCREKLLQKSGSQTRVRTDGPVIFDGERCQSRCYWCKADVTLPLQLSEQMAPAPTHSHVIRIKR